MEKHNQEATRRQGGRKQEKYDGKQRRKQVIKESTKRQRGMRRETRKGRKWEKNKKTHNQGNNKKDKDE